MVDGIPNRALKHLPLSVVSLFVVLFNAIFSKAVLPDSLEARTRVFYPETRGKSGYALILSTHKCARHDWQTVLENHTLQDSLRSEQTWVIVRWAVWVQAQTQHCATDRPPCRKSVQELWRNEARYSSMWLRPSILYGSTVSSTSSKSFIFPRILSKQYLHICIVGRLKRPSKQPHPLVVAYGLA